MDMTETEIIEDIDEYIEKEYKKYYENILDQMREQGFSKVQIAVQKMMYETREDLLDKFVDRYGFEDVEFEFIPEEEEI